MANAVEQHISDDGERVPMLTETIGLGFHHWQGISSAEWLCFCASAGTCALLFLWLQRNTRLSVETQSRVISSIHALVATTVAIMSFFEVRESLLVPSAEMWFSAPTYGRRMLAITCGYLYFDVFIVLYLWVHENQPDAGILTHHLLILAGYLLGLASSFGTPYQTILLINEASTPFVNIHVAVRPQGVWRVVNGLVLWLSYASCRVAFNTYMAYSVSVTLTPEVWRHEGLQLLLQLCAFYALQILNIRWFISITRGLVKAVTARKEPSRATSVTPALPKSVAKARALKSLSTSSPPAETTAVPAADMSVSGSGGLPSVRNRNARKRASSPRFVTVAHGEGEVAPGRGLRSPKSPRRKSVGPAVMPITSDRADEEKRFVFPEDVAYPRRRMATRTTAAR